MPTPPRSLFPCEIYHVYNRSAGKKTIFHTPRDYERFITKAREYKARFPVDILAYCVMPNHFHLLIRVPTPGVVATPGVVPSPSSAETFLHRILTSYARYYVTHHEEHSGHVFQGRYCAKHVGDDGYLTTLIAYIHDNPVRQGLVDMPHDWPYSSYADLTHTRPDGITTHDDTLTNLDHTAIYAAFARSRDAGYQTIAGLV